MSGGLELLYFVERLWSLVAGLVVLLLHFALPVPFRRFVDALWYHFCFLTCETSMYFLVEGVLELAGGVGLDSRGAASLICGSAERSWSTS